MEATEALQALLRWIHIVAGIIWIRLLYFFNFVNAAFAATMDGPTKQKVVPELMPRALYWFRWRGVDLGDRRAAAPARLLARGDHVRPWGRVDDVRRAHGPGHFPRRGALRRACQERLEQGHPAHRRRGLGARGAGHPGLPARGLRLPRLRHPHRRDVRH